MDSRWKRALRRDNLTMVGKLLVVVALMGGFGYALVPIYKHICEALGINVLGSVDRRDAVKNSQIDYSRTVTVEFDTNARGPWDFKPAKNYVTVHPGELVTVNYSFRNKQDRVMAAQAIPSYAPKQATAHFQKFECFCFNEYTLKPGEEKEWPVVFVVSPKLPKDVKTITLSYTFFEVAGKKLAQSGKGQRGMSPEAREPASASFGQTLKAVAWSFFGIRKGAEYERDVARLKPVHVIVAGVIGAAVFVGALVLLVRWVTSSGVAAA